MSPVMMESADRRGGPHPGIQLLVVVVAASVIGATARMYLFPGPSIDKILLAMSVGLLAVSGAYGIIKDRPIVGVIAALGFVLLLEPLGAQLGLFLLIGTVGFLLASTLSTVDRIRRERRTKGGH